MALRIRFKKKSGTWDMNDRRPTIVCAADEPAEPGDIYVADDLHYFLAVVVKVIRTYDGGKTWQFCCLMKSSRSLLRWKKKTGNNMRKSSSSFQNNH
jgi:hypothetical protein